ncbi:uncharacterized protein AMSG_08614 [Thecamonas trahens ATCC 50062]|uniref:Hydroxyproline O-arabinosyltransferase-like domain-containing protein n=1 Tax=Thecamonas trahens ATCC 50062 TaxID=461836 RepID=A0A0L0DL32_THETB|nr:hypothetical protein AMSG_08614 [Thecamonas trahens ATCC 50062]KNC52736.1 hypothetical protein AMSG_08614 [Thecamonas trahens ATCC 50062]|eukprot:XP_013755050.1 hypothetical protein AMSG_08614 [Thecamonas trahens ATCC 50062]
MAEWDERCNWSDDSEAEKKRRGPIRLAGASGGYGSGGRFGAGRSESGWLPAWLTSSGHVRSRGVLVGLALFMVIVIYLMPLEHHLGEAPQPLETQAGGEGLKNPAAALPSHAGVRGAVVLPANEVDGSETLMILMLSDNAYQVWQMRLFHYHYLKVKQPGKLVTIVSSPGRAEPSFSCDEPFMTCPIFITDDYATAPNGDHFVVYNRAEGLREFLSAFRAGSIASLDPAVLTNVVIVEPDFLLIKPITAIAARHAPVGHHYFYMEADYPWSNNSYVINNCSPRPAAVAPIGVPYIIHADDLWQILPAWIESTRWNRFPQPWANNEKSWIADMWGFACAAASLGWNSIADKQLAPEPPMDADISHRSVAIHYTYGQEVGNFAFNKRDWFGPPVPRPLPPIPDEASPLQHLWYDLINEALLNVLARPTGGMCWSFEVSLGFASLEIAGMVALAWRGGRRDWAVLPLLTLLTGMELIEAGLWLTDPTPWPPPRRATCSSTANSLLTHLAALDLFAQPMAVNWFGAKAANGAAARLAHRTCFTLACIVAAAAAVASIWPQALVRLSHADVIDASHSFGVATCSFVGPHGHLLWQFGVPAGIATMAVMPNQFVWALLWCAPLALFFRPRRVGWILLAIFAVLFGATWLWLDGSAETLSVFCWLGIAVHGYALALPWLAPERPSFHLKRS